MNSIDSTWEEYRDGLVRFICSRGVEHHDAEDIAHNVILKAIAPGGGPTDPSKLRPWLYQVVRTAVADHWRGRRPQGEFPENFAAQHNEQDATDQLMSCLDPFMSRLSEIDAMALRMADANSLPQAEVAKQLGLSISGAKSRIQRARAKVFAMYRECCQVELDRKGRVRDYDDSCANQHCSPPQTPTSS